MVLAGHTRRVSRALLGPGRTGPSEDHKEAGRFSRTPGRGWTQQTDGDSASDHLTMVMQGMENVTVMGFTEPNGSGQGVNGIELASGALSFSSSLMLKKDGSIYVDSGVDREGGNEIDVVIPFDEEAVRVLFAEEGDYVLQKCLEYYQE